MSATALQQQLAATGQLLGRWQAELRAAIFGAIALGLLALLGATDLLLQLSPLGRVIAWALVLLVVAAGLWRIWAAFAAQPSVEAIAARIEKHFPQLDNHLINFVQFSRRPPTDPLATAYLQQDIPGWSQINVHEMRDRPGHRRAYLILAAAAALLLAPALWTSAWTNSLFRILNPFSQRSASTLADILSVTPGHATITAGKPLTLACQVTGKSGQEVWLEIQPADDKPSRIKIGDLTGHDTETFTYALPQLAANLQYRFRAGDARSDQFQITLAPPLALAALTATVTPPAYTGLPTQKIDALAEPVLIPQGAEVAVTLRANRPLTTAAIAGLGATSSGDDWTASLPITAARSLVISAVAVDGEHWESTLSVQIIPDKAPAIRVINPTGRTALPPGAEARIQWEVTDDYGLTRIVLQKENGDPIAEWQPEQPRTFAHDWTGPVGTYRIVAHDQIQRSQSSLLVFETVRPKELAAAQTRNLSETAATLARVVALQKSNLDQTTQLTAHLAATTPAQWQSLATVQKTIRQLTGQLLGDPRLPLGALQAVIQETYRGPMLTVLDVLDRVPTAPADKRSLLATQAVVLETQILRVLTAANDTYARIESHRQVSGILALLDALVAGQEEILKSVRAGATGSAIANKQDKLAGDVSDFIQAARAEVRRVERSDAEFGKIVQQVADACEARQVGADMLRAAEKLEAQAPAAAIPFADNALANLKEFQALLNQWRVAQAKETMADVRQTVAESGEKFDKLVKLQAQLVEALRQVNAGKDLSKEDKEKLQQELVAVKDNIRQAALKIADDLHIFPELPVGNELVKDIFQVFEEVKQVPGSDKAEAQEIGLQKEDFLLDMMENIKERFDDMEMWLTAKPDNVKRLTENFDQAEMPKMAVIDLPKEMEDIIGELLEQQKDIEEKAHDSATNQATPDMPMGWDVVEGEWSNFSGKGKSGNEAPDHKEQDGRSLVGRQGMADGETVAGSGKINKGDDKIENRMTQDPAQAGKVEEEDHADAVATGGGKESGWDNELGMPGQGPRRDSDLPGSDLGLQVMLRRNAEALYARASMLHIRTGSLDEVVRALREAEEAMRDRRPIQQVRELQRRAAAALQKAQADLSSGFHEAAIPGATTTPVPPEQLAGVPDEAPAQYRDLVAEYFKSLSAAP